MSLPANTLWYSGDWNLFVGINPFVTAMCSCSTAGSTLEECSSRPPNELYSPTNILMATYSDFDVTFGLGWLVSGLFSNNFTLVPFNLLQNLQATYEIRENVSVGNPGNLITSGIAPVTVTPTGRSAISGPDTYIEYRFLVQGLSVNLPFGTFYMNVAPIVNTAISNLYGNFVFFNSTTVGVNSIGFAPGNDFVVIGVPQPMQFVSSTDFGNEYRDFSNGVIGVLFPICIHPDMTAMLQDGRQLSIKDLRPGMMLQTCKDKKKAPAKLIFNLRNDAVHNTMVHIEKDAISPDVPDNTLIITTNHPVVINDEYIKPRSLLNGKTIKRKKYVEPLHTHTLITNNGKPVLINNLLVSTWSLKKWKELYKL